MALALALPLCEAFGATTPSQCKQVHWAGSYGRYDIAGVKLMPNGVSEPMDGFGKWSERQYALGCSKFEGGAGVHYTIGHPENEFYVATGDCLPLPWNMNEMRCLEHGGEDRDILMVKEVGPDCEVTEFYGYWEHLWENEPDNPVMKDGRLESS